MKPGLYETLVTCGLAQRLEMLPPTLKPHLRPVEPAEAPRVLTQHLAQVLQRALTSLKGDSGGLEVVSRRAPGLGGGRVA